MLQQWQLMSSNGRDVSDLSREELEDILMEMHEELEIRKQTAHNLNSRVTQLNTRVQVVQSSVQDVNIQYVKQPKALRPTAPYKAWTKSSKSPTKEKGNFEIQVVGSYNPYEAGIRRVTTLQHKLGDLQQQLLDINAETKALQAEKLRLARSLENRELPTKEIFKHEKPIPKHFPESQVIDARKCMKALESLIDAESDPDEKDLLLCCHMLLTGHDKKALELFSVLYNPDAKPEDRDILQDALADREAQVTILLQQFKNLVSRHKSLKEAYVDLRQRLKGHVIDKEDVIFSLKRQIDEIQERIDQLPKITGETENLRKRRDDLKNEIEEIQKKARNSVSVEVGMKKQEAEVKRDIAGKRVHLQQLEVRNNDWTERHEERSSRLKTITDELEEKQSKYDEIAGQKNSVQEKMNALNRAKLRTAEQVKETYEMSKSTSPEELYIERQVLNNECKKKEKDMKDLKHECKALNTSLQDKTQQIQSLQARIKSIKSVIDDSKSKEPEVYV